MKTLYLWINDFVENKEDKSLDNYSAAIRYQMALLQLLEQGKISFDDKKWNFNIVQNNNEVAGQTVFHFHMHLIPRYQDDNQNLVMQPNEMSPEELDAVRDTIVS